jgi:hypothetical protein
MNNDARPLLDEIDARDYQDRQDELSRHARLKTTEAALRNLGVDKESACGRLLRLVVRIAGLGVLMRSNVELAHEIGTSHARVAQRAAAGLENVGLLRRGVLRGANGRSVGVALQADWARIAELSESSSTVLWTTTTPTTPTTTGTTTTPTTTPTTPTMTGTTTSTTTTPMTSTTTGTTTNGSLSLYPLSLSQDPSSASQSRYVDSDDDDDEDLDSPNYDDVVEAFEKLSAAVAKKHSPKRVELSRIQLWQSAWFGVMLGERIVDRWIRSAWRVADDFDDYFFGCARREAGERGLSWQIELTRAKACPAPHPQVMSPKRCEVVIHEETAELDEAAREYLRSIGKDSMIQRLERT